MERKMNMKDISELNMVFSFAVYHLTLLFISMFCKMEMNATSWRGGCFSLHNPVQTGPGVNTSPYVHSYTG
jgi:hypothetical protein